MGHSKSANIATLRAVKAARLTRAEQKERTRIALLDAALRLLERKSFGSLGLREVAREAGVVPTAFYRHFESMEELGLVLIDDSFRTLRRMIRDARSEPLAYGDVIRSSVEILVRHVHAHRLHFRFVARERSSGVPVLRQAIRAEIRLFSSELATDLARFPYLDRWSTEDLGMFATLIVNTMVSTAEEIVEAPSGRPEAEREIVRRAEKQLRLIAFGVPVWRSEGAAAPDAGDGEPAAPT
ncbi:MAG TPA: TetR family transcriptional regulator [Conexibacter sp.]|jgi:AcrR family transcriptional regulator|nr:TetR family transcriptional regulator [Conexibacter sp.]